MHSQKSTFLVLWWKFFVRFKKAIFKWNFKSNLKEMFFNSFYGFNKLFFSLLIFVERLIWRWEKKCTTCWRMTEFTEFVTTYNLTTLTKCLGWNSFLLNLLCQKWTLVETFNWLIAFFLHSNRNLIIIQYDSNILHEVEVNKKDHLKWNLAEKLNELYTTHKLKILCIYLVKSQQSQVEVSCKQ